VKGEGRGGTELVQLGPALVTTTERWLP